MGIPRFYRWLSERYPLINEKIGEGQIPEFDNLYLDMNGIIHNCISVITEEGGTEEDLFARAFEYINRLFTIIKPKQVLYMALDGVAPRAKMNQQRSRRFRSANDSREAKEEALKYGGAAAAASAIGGNQPSFDRNAITPGTEFMYRLSQHLDFYVQKKMESDTLWAECATVILSGPECPGEGEHKIMEYIRNAKSQPDYNPETRHCLYGLDADLIMLALVSHEPRFVLLREEIKFGRVMVKPPSSRMLLQESEFQLMHIGLVREYLDLEFGPKNRNSAVNMANSEVVGNGLLDQTTTTTSTNTEATKAISSNSDVTTVENTNSWYDVERVIDDFILICAMVGNDFLPHLPFFDIAQGGLNTLFDAYKKYVAGFPSKSACVEDPYLTSNCGDIQFGNVLKFLDRGYQKEIEFMNTIITKGGGSFDLGRMRMCGPDSQEAPQPFLRKCRTIGQVRRKHYAVKFRENVFDVSGHPKKDKLEIKKDDLIGGVSAEDAILVEEDLDKFYDEAYIDEIVDKFEAERRLEKDRIHANKALKYDPNRDLSAGFEPGLSDAAQPDATSIGEITKANSEVTANGFGRAGSREGQNKDLLLSAVPDAELLKAPTDTFAQGDDDLFALGGAMMELGLGDDSDQEESEGLTKVSSSDTDKLWKLVDAYLEGLQWVIYYYFRGPDMCGWTWFFPYYQAPLLVDMYRWIAKKHCNANGLDEHDASGLMKLPSTIPYGKRVLKYFEDQSNIRGPVTPFTQLMSVLPAGSKELVPKLLHPLFLPSSEIAAFYPTHFAIDIDGVKVPWGGVALIPFIDPVRLDAIMLRFDKHYTKAEKERNHCNGKRIAYTVWKDPDKIAASNSKADQGIMPAVAVDSLAKSVAEQGEFKTSSDALSTAASSTNRRVQRSNGFRYRDSPQPIPMPVGYVQTTMPKYFSSFFPLKVKRYEFFQPVLPSCGTESKETKFSFKNYPLVWDEEKNEPVRLTWASQFGTDKKVAKRSPNYIGERFLGEFPTLHCLDVHSANLDSGVQVFDRPAQQEGLYINMKTAFTSTTEKNKELAESYVGQVVFVDYPFTRLGLVKSVITYDGNEKSHQADARYVTNFLEKHGINATRQFWKNIVLVEIVGVARDGTLQASEHKRVRLPELLVKPPIMALGRSNAAALGVLPTEDNALEAGEEAVLRKMNAALCKDYSGLGTIAPLFYQPKTDMYDFSKATFANAVASMEQFNKEGQDAVKNPILQEILLPSLCQPQLYLCIDAKSKAFGHAGTVKPGTNEIEFKVLKSEPYIEEENKLKAFLRDNKVLREESRPTLLATSASSAASSSVIVPDNDTSDSEPGRWLQIRDIFRAFPEINSGALIKILGSVKLKTVFHNEEEIGLNMIHVDNVFKDNRWQRADFCLPGLVKMEEGGTSVRSLRYSSKILPTIRAYKEQYPKLFEKLGKDEDMGKSRYESSKSPTIHQKDLFGNQGKASKEQILWETDRMLKFLMGLPHMKLRFVPLKHQCIPSNLIKSKLEGIVSEFADVNDTKNAADTETLTLPFNPSKMIGTLCKPPKPRQTNFTLGQRVVYATVGGVIKLGSKGTVVGVYYSAETCLEEGAAIKVDSDGNVDNCSLIKATTVSKPDSLEVLFDTINVGAGDLGSRCSSMRGLMVKPNDLLTVQTTQVAVVDDGFCSHSKVGVYVDSRRDNTGKGKKDKKEKKAEKKGQRDGKGEKGDTNGDKSTENKKDSINASKAGTPEILKKGTPKILKKENSQKKENSKDKPNGKDKPDTSQTNGKTNSQANSKDKPSQGNNKVQGSPSTDSNGEKKKGKGKNKKAKEKAQADWNEKGQDPLNESGKSRFEDKNNGTSRFDKSDSKDSSRFDNTNASKSNRTDSKQSASSAESNGTGKGKGKNKKDKKGRGKGNGKHAYAEAKGNGKSKGTSHIEGSRSASYPTAGGYQNIVPSYASAPVNYTAFAPHAAATYPVYGAQPLGQQLGKGGHFQAASALYQTDYQQTLAASSAPYPLYPAATYQVAGNGHQAYPYRAAPRVAHTVPTAYLTGAPSASYHPLPQGSPHAAPISVHPESYHRVTGAYQEGGKNKRKGKGKRQQK